MLWKYNTVYAKISRNPERLHNKLCIMCTVKICFSVLIAGINVKVYSQKVCIASFTVIEMKIK